MHRICFSLVSALIAFPLINANAAPYQAEDRVHLSGSSIRFDAPICTMKLVTVAGAGRFWYGAPDLAEDVLRTQSVSAVRIILVGQEDCPADAYLFEEIDSAEFISDESAAP